MPHMEQSLVIEGITFHGHCGVTPEERQTLQPLLADIELDCDHQEAIAQDDIRKTVDYASVTNTIVEFGSTQEFALIETFAEQLTHMLLLQYPISRISIWLRKTRPPLSNIAGSVGVRLTRHQHLIVHDRVSIQPPSPFLVEQLPRLPKGRLLDVAMGYGRHAIFMANRGYQVEGIDRDKEAIRTVAKFAHQHHGSNLMVRTVDLEPEGAPPPPLGTEQYDVILVFFYLYRPLFPNLVAALKPGGMLVYETFSIDNHLIHHHPQRREFCLEHNELLTLVPGLRILYFHEGEHPGKTPGESIFTARLLAQKPPQEVHGQN